MAVFFPKKLSNYYATLDVIGWFYPCAADLRAVANQKIGLYPEY
jgi:hypothetical protein